MRWLEAVGIPYLALIAIALIAIAVAEGRGGWESLARKFLELGIDLCILGLGITGAIFGSDMVTARLGNHTTPIGIACIFIDLIVTGFCLHLRSADPKDESPGKASVSIFLGLLILGFNSEIVFRLT
jgi:hypothetical protein